VLSKRIKRGKVSRRSRSCWVYIGAVYHVGLQNGGEMDRGLLRSARRQAGRPNWIASDTAKRFSPGGCEIGSGDDANRRAIFSHPHEYGGLVLNAQQRVGAHGFERDGIAFRSSIPKPEDIGHAAASNFRILRVQLQIWPRLHGKSDRRRDGRIRNCFRREAFQGRECCASLCWKARIPRQHLTYFVQSPPPFAPRALRADADGGRARC
jgi:hypothetical protein